VRHANRLPERIALALYFVACEALTNVAKHAQARADSIRVSRNGENVGIEIADDGVGGANSAGGTGLSGLADRVAALDGELRCTSPAGQGTVLTATLPCACPGTDSPTPSPDMGGRPSVHGPQSEWRTLRGQRVRRNSPPCPT